MSGNYEGDRTMWRGGGAELLGSEIVVMVLVVVMMWMETWFDGLVW